MRANAQQVFCFTYSTNHFKADCLNLLEYTQIHGNNCELFGIKQLVRRDYNLQQVEPKNRHIWVFNPYLIENKTRVGNMLVNVMFLTELGVKSMSVLFRR
jgi:hypothetical protein